MRQESDEIFINTDDLKRALEDPNTDDKDIIQKLSEIKGVEEYFKKKAASSRLEEMMFVSRVKSPLTQFPPDVKSNLYSSVLTFAVDNCPEVLKVLLDILVKRGAPVMEKDVLRVSFMFSSLAHGISRHNNSVMKTKSLVLKSEGLIDSGLDQFGLLGISEASRATLNTTDLLAEVSDAMLRDLSKTMSSQSTIDNLDFQSHHMCLEYKQLERQDTSDMGKGNDTASANID